METGETGDLELLENSKVAIKADDLFTIINTSDTTSRPNGTMLTHQNLFCNVKSISETIYLEEGKHKLFAPLPYL